MAWNMQADIKNMLQLARQVGFEHAGPICMEALVPREEIRKMCAAGRCKRYGHSWSCPPACGEVEQNAACIASYQQGILVQTTGLLADAFDMEGMQAAEKSHKQRFDTLVRQARRLLPDYMALAAGSCTRCRVCTYPDRPCRFPDKLYPSMEACGLWVSDVCTRSGIGYNYGENTITYTSCLLFDKKEENL